MGLLVLADERSLEHEPPDGHPERPDRYRAAVSGLVHATVREAIEWAEPTPAPASALRAVHSDDHVDQIEAAAGRPVRIDPDTFMSAGSLTAARLAAGAGLDAIAALEADEHDAALCLVRPPGHHATPTRAMGFCLFNNVAVTAQQLTERGHRVAIVDFDAHHGNGTQDVFYDRDDVLFVSLHEYPQYPGTGSVTEIGAGAGVGATINLPLPSGATGDVYLRAFDEVIAPALEDFGADWLLVSAGFDAHRSDPLTHMGLTAADFADLTDRMVEVSAPGRRIAFLEGGYDLDALAASTAAFAAALIGESDRSEAASNGGPGGEVVATVAQLHRR